MANVFLKKIALEQIKSQLKKMQSETESAQKRLDSVMSGLDFEVASKENIKGTLSKLNTSLYKQITLSEQYCSTFTTVSNTFLDSDGSFGGETQSILDKIKDYIEDTTQSIKEFFNKNKIAKYATVAGLFIASPSILCWSSTIIVLEKIGEWVKGWFTVVAHAEDDNGDGSNNDNNNNNNNNNNDNNISDDDNNSPTPNEETKMTEAEIKAEIEARTERVRSEHGSFNNYCGAYAYQQLEDQGLVAGKDVGGLDPGANGKDWIETWENKSTTNAGASVEVYRGNNSLIDFINQHPNESLTNIVVSYDDIRGPEKYGHALLISRIQDGKIYFTDTEGAIKWFRNSSGQPYHEGEMAVMTIDEFMKYPGSNYKLKGIIHFSK